MASRCNSYTRQLGYSVTKIFDHNNPEQRNDILDRIDKEAVTKRLMDMLDIRNQEDQSIGITNVHPEEIKEYLKALDLIVVMYQMKPIIPSTNPLENTIFTQLGMRYCQAQAFVYSLTKDEFICIIERTRKNNGV